jgi:ABC-2 type transport system ATP-binding protein
MSVITGERLQETGNTEDARVSTAVASSSISNSGADERDRIVLQNVSKFYGEVLGVNRVNLSIPPGVTGLVGPNGSGKTTLMNLITGLIRPTEGRISVVGISPTKPEELFRRVGYCAQFDSFPKGATGFSFVYNTLRLHGLDDHESVRLTHEALDRVSMTEAAFRKVAGYSKGMRQRIRLAQAICHHPTVLILDEPLNGLDPMARAESLELFQALGKQGLHVVISSHILHEVDKMSDQVILMSSGYVVAEGKIHTVRTEVKEHPMQILVRCSDPNLLASRVFAQDHVVEVKLNEDGKGVLVRTRDADAFYLLLNQLVVKDNISMDAVAPADDDVNSVYQYLIGSENKTI